MNQVLWLLDKDVKASMKTIPHEVKKNILEMNENTGVLIIEIEIIKKKQGENIIIEKYNI